MAREALVGRVWAAGVGERWVCDCVAWTGLRCVAVLNNGNGEYRELTLRDWSFDGVAGFVEAVGERLRAFAADRTANGAGLGEGS